MDPMWAMQCMGSGGIPDEQLGCVPAPLYPAVRKCVDDGGSWDPYLQLCVPAGLKGGIVDTVGKAICAAMGGTWNPQSGGCNSGGKFYSSQQLVDKNKGGTQCPPDKPLLTPTGCQAWPVPQPGQPCLPPLVGTFPNCTWQSLPPGYPPAKPPPKEWTPAQTTTTSTSAGMSTGAKVALGVGIAAGAIALVALLTMGSKKRATPNLRRSPYPIGHKTAPKKYRLTGATKRSQYAFPVKWSYPIHDRKHVIRAKGRFTQHKWRYSMDNRRTIASNINKAAKRFGLSADVKP